MEKEGGHWHLGMTRFTVFLYCIFTTEQYSVVFPKAPIKYTYSLYSK